MGNLCSGDSLPPVNANQMTEDQRNRYLTKQLKKEKILSNLEIKLLLLGAGDSGKSTLFKQMKINYGTNFGENQLKGEKDRILMTVLEAFGWLLKDTPPPTEKELVADPDQEAAIEEAKARLVFDDRTRLQRRVLWLAEEGQDDLAKVIARAWKTPRLQRVWIEDAPSDPNIPSTLSHFCDKIMEFSRPEYLPTIEDYLLARVRTAGVLEQKFTYKKVPFLIIDVGGQKAERKKWIKCFDGVTAVIFVAALSDFDQTLFEDGNINRLTESIDLFSKTTKTLVFRGLPFILFLNKVDLLREKLLGLKARGKDLAEYFPLLDLPPHAPIDEAEKKIMAHVKQRYEDVSESKTLYTHFVTAIDKNVFVKVFETTANIILTNTINIHFNGQV